MKYKKPIKHLINYTLFLIIPILILTSSCAPDFDNVEDFHKSKDVLFTVTTTNLNTESNPNAFSLKFLIHGPGINISESLKNQSFISYESAYLNQIITYGTTLSITYKDNTNLKRESDFKPYNITLNISINKETLIEKDFLITEVGSTNTIKYVMD